RQLLLGGSDVDAIEGASAYPGTIGLARTLALPSRRARSAPESSTRFRCYLCDAVSGASGGAVRVRLAAVTRALRQVHAAQPRKKGPLNSGGVWRTCWTDWWR